MILHFTIRTSGARPDRKFLVAVSWNLRKYQCPNFGLPIASETMYDFIRERIGARLAIGRPDCDAPFVRPDVGADAALLRPRPCPSGGQRPGGARSPRRS